MAKHCFRLNTRVKSDTHTDVLIGYLVDTAFPFPVINGITLKGAFIGHLQLVVLALLKKKKHYNTLVLSISMKDCKENVLQLHDDVTTHNSELFCTSISLTPGQF